MDPPPPKPKRSVRKTLQRAVDNVFRRSPSPAASQDPPQAESTRPHLPSPLPQTPQADLSSRADEASSTPTPAIDSSVPATSRTEPPTIVVLPAPPDSSGATKEKIDQDTKGVWANLGTALRFLQKSAGSLPPLQSAIGSFISCVDILEEVAMNRKDYEELAVELASLSELLAQHMNESGPGRMSGSIASIAQAIEEQGKLIGNKRKRATGSRVAESATDREQLDKCYRKIGSLFRQLQADAQLSIWSIVNEQMANARLKELEAVKLAAYDSKLSTSISRRTCTANTRTAILSGLDDWSYLPDGAKVYWMNGMAGTGKTTIACSFSESLEERKQLAASFFCTRTVPECRSVSRIIPTIAYQFARYSIPFQSALCAALAEDPDVGSKKMTKQFEQLLKSPILKIQEALPSNLVVVIDALDECDDIREVELLLSILLKSAADIPLRFFVTSRPEPEIYGRMQTRRLDASKVLHLHEVERSLVQADIELYLTEELEFMAPTPAQIKQLAQRSGSLFIYAATLVRSIVSYKSRADPHRRLRSLLAAPTEPARPNAQIDGLYAAILEATLGDKSEYAGFGEIENVRRVLQIVICVQEPISVETLTVLAELDDEFQVVDALQPLLAVIHFSEKTGLVSTFHVSFSDFMFNPTRSKLFHCNPTDQNSFLTRRCFKVMNDQLRFNICNLESSFRPDSEVPDLDERVEKCISKPLSYACRHWGGHLQLTANSDSLNALLSEFICIRLLFWMEVLNLKGEKSLGGNILLKARQWLLTGAVSPDLTRLVEDARNFVMSFAIGPVSQATPHIYLSLLPFCSRSSSVYKNYRNRLRGLMNPTGTAMRQRDTAALASWRIASMVASVAYSPDGMTFAFGCSDGTSSIRSIDDGGLIAGPFIGHINSVQSVAYSPDGANLVSGSNDQTIRVWGIQESSLVAGPFEGHTDTIVSTIYSPDGTCIASGSHDATIRIWNARSGRPVLSPIRGHTEPITSVAYSPDGTRIASGSWDGSVRVWDVKTGTLVAGPFHGHNGCVYSVTYSPDGRHIASGSEDAKIRVLDLHSGTLVAGPLEGHEDSVLSLAYSPDGLNLVSGAHDSTRLWDTNNWKVIAGPPHGDTGRIVSVAYSPDGTRIISGSFDGSIRLWDTRDLVLESLTVPCKGHQGGIISVACSPDGACIASGASDNTIIVWNASGGDLIAGPLRGHTSVVSAVVYSPDGVHIASASWDKTVRVWDSRDGVLVAGLFQGHDREFESLAYSPDGICVAAGSRGSTILIGNAQSGELVLGPLQGHTGSVLSLAYSPNGTHIVSGSSDQTTRVWDSSNGALVAGPFDDYGSSVQCLTYSPDGLNIACGTLGLTVVVRNAYSGRIVAEFPHRNSYGVVSVSYSPDGAYVVTCSVDYAIRIWETSSGTSIADHFPSRLPGALTSAALSPDGASVVLGSSVGSVRTMDICRIMPRTAPIIAHDNPTRLASLSSSDEMSNLNTSHSSPPLSHPTQSCSPHKTNHLLDLWTIRRDGWVINNDALLFWVPPEIAEHLPTTHNRLVITPFGTLQVDYSHMTIGEDWNQCYCI